MKQTLVGGRDIKKYEMLAGGDLSRAADLDCKWVQVDDIEKQMVLAILGINCRLPRQL